MLVSVILRVRRCELPDPHVIFFFFCVADHQMDSASQGLNKEQQDKLAALLAKARLTRLYAAFLREKVSQGVCIIHVLPPVGI